MKKPLFLKQPNTRLKMKNTLFVSYEFACLQLRMSIQLLALTRKRIASTINKYSAVVTVVPAYLAGIMNNIGDSQREIDKNTKPTISIIPIKINWLLHSSIVINPKPAAL
jgi:hypothetical protein